MLIFGHRERMLEVFEHLLSNAMRAVEDRGSDDEMRAVRMTVAREEKRVQVVVSDSGTGFEDPARAFDPFFTTRSPMESRGMGLAVCYAVVREHGGEISAFNLQPHGAAVVVDLPLGCVATETGEAALQCLAE